MLVWTSFDFYGHRVEVVDALSLISLLFSSPSGSLCSLQEIAHERIEISGTGICVKQLTKMEEENIGQSLLKKQYYENCPGCKADQAKELKTDVSIRNLSYIWIVVLCGSKH